MKDFCKRLGISLDFNQYLLGDIKDFLGMDLSPEQMYEQLGKKLEDLDSKDKLGKDDLNEFNNIALKKANGEYPDINNYSSILMYYKSILNKINTDSALKNLAETIPAFSKLNEELHNNARIEAERNQEEIDRAKDMGENLKKYDKMGLKELSDEANNLTSGFNSPKSIGQEKNILEKKKVIVMWRIQAILAENNVIIRYNDKNKLELFKTTSGKTKDKDGKEINLEDIYLNDENLQAMSILVGASNKDLEAKTFESAGAMQNMYADIIKEFKLKKADGSIWNYPGDFKYESGNSITSEKQIKDNKTAFLSQINEVIKGNKAKGLEGLEEKNKKPGTTDDYKTNCHLLQKLEIIKIDLLKENGMLDKSIDFASNLIKKRADAPNDFAKALFDGGINELILSEIPILLVSAGFAWLAKSLLGDSVGTDAAYALIGVYIGGDALQKLKASGLDLGLEKKPASEEVATTKADQELKELYAKADQGITDIPNCNPKFYRSYAIAINLLNKSKNNSVFNTDRQRFNRLFLLATSDKTFLTTPITDGVENKGYALFGPETQKLLPGPNRNITAEDIKNFILLFKNNDKTEDITTKETGDHYLGDLFIDKGQMEPDTFIDEHKYVEAVDGGKEYNRNLNKLIGDLPGIPYWVGRETNIFSNQERDKSQKAKVQEALEPVSPNFITINGKQFSGFVKKQGNYNLPDFYTTSIDNLESAINSLELLKHDPIFSGSIYPNKLTEIIKVYQDLKLQEEAKRDANNVKPDPKILTGAKKFINGASTKILGAFTSVTDKDSQKTISEWTPVFAVENKANLSNLIINHNQLKTDLTTGKYQNLDPVLKARLQNELKETEFEIKENKFDLLTSKDKDKKDLLIDLIKIKPDKVKEKFEKITSELNTILEIDPANESLEGYLPKLLIAQPYLEQVASISSIDTSKITGLNSEQLAIITNLQSSKDVYTNFRTNLEKIATNYQKEIDPTSGLLKTDIGKANTLEELQPILLRHYIINQNLTGDGIVKSLGKEAQNLLGILPTGDTKTTLESLVNKTDAIFGKKPVGKAKSTFNFGGIGTDYITNLDTIKVGIRQKAETIIGKEFGNLNFTSPKSGSIELEIEKFANLKVKSSAFGAYTGDSTRFKTEYEKKENELATYLITEINKSSTKTKSDVESKFAMFNKIKGFPFFEGENYNKIELAVKSKLEKLILDTELDSPLLPVNIKEEFNIVNADYGILGIIKAVKPKPTVHHLINELRNLESSATTPDEKRKLRNHYERIKNFANGDDVSAMFNTVGFKAGVGFDYVVDSITKGAGKIAGLDFQAGADAVGNAIGGIISGGLITPISTLINNFHSSSLSTTDSIMLLAALGFFFKK